MYWQKEVSSPVVLDIAPQVPLQFALAVCSLDEWALPDYIIVGLEAGGAAEHRGASTASSLELPDCAPADSNLEAPANFPAFPRCFEFLHSTQQLPTSIPGRPHSGFLDFRLESAHNQVARQQLAQDGRP